MTAPGRAPTLAEIGEALYGRAHYGNPDETPG